MSILSLGEPLPGPGNLYPWGEDRILKLYGSEVPADWVRRLGRVERSLYAAGLPLPEVGEIVEFDDHLGQVYERVEGTTLAENLLGTTKADLDTLVRLAGLFAEVHADIHTHSAVPELASQKSILSSVIRRIADLPADLKAATLDALQAMPENDRLCHGDFHPFNVMLSPRGPIVIDWPNAHAGNPLEDVARSKLMLEGAQLSDGISSELVDLFNSAYLDRYFELCPGSRAELAAWQPIVAAVRLSDDIPALRDWLVEQVRIGLTPYT